MVEESSVSHWLVVAEENETNVQSGPRIKVCGPDWLRTLRQSLGHRRSTQILVRVGKYKAP